jgi:hypothetical protein
MHAASNSARRTGSATADDALTVARRRAERFDMLVASVLLLALIFGWVVRFAPPETWPRGDFFMASTTRHA